MQVSGGLGVLDVWTSMVDIKKDSREVRLPASPQEWELGIKMQDFQGAANSKQGSVIIRTAWQFLCCPQARSGHLLLVQGMCEATGSRRPRPYAVSEGSRVRDGS